MPLFATPMPRRYAAAATPLLMMPFSLDAYAPFCHAAAIAMRRYADICHYFLTPHAAFTRRCGILLRHILFYFSQRFSSLFRYVLPATPIIFACADLTTPDTCSPPYDFATFTPPYDAAAAAARHLSPALPRCFFAALRHAAIALFAATMPPRPLLSLAQRHTPRRRRDVLI